MFRLRLSVTITLMLLGAMICGCAAKPKESGFLTDYSRLEPVQEQENYLRYVAPGDALSKYSGIIVDPITIHLYDQSEAKDVKPQDTEHLKQFLYAQLIKDLKEANFNVMSDPGPSVLRLRIALTNLKQGTPALNVIPHTKLTGIGLGQVAAEGELVDSVTGHQLAAAIKSDTGSRFSFSGLSTWGDAEAVLKDWSKTFVNRLANARAKMRTA